MFCCCAAETKAEDLKFAAVSSAVELPPPEVEEARPPMSEELPATQIDEEPPATQPVEEPEAPKELEPAKEPEAPVVPEPQAPPAEFLEFEVVLEKSPERKVVGMNVDSSPKSNLAIKGINADSLLSYWNKANPEKKVQIGDAVVSVNGTDNSSAMINTLKDETALRLVIRRVPEFVVCVDKTAGPLGMVVHGGSKAPATISQVHDGKVISAYNKEAEAGKVVVPGDIVLEVNGVKGDKEEIVAAISRADGVLNLLLKHPTA